ncbi:MAG: 2-succinyl-5-enolpyruvyl-6-hydroxy-3-cyclohexene-1-carboxylic-acid synthase [Dehalococcoidia bacterium]|nr:2-succinyl-5-enolpyruvyl-6-hydroxy-3-cyclohexene-1-carboxylic-acid synthase [Dehalococcoidia bacterium]
MALPADRTVHALLQSLSRNGVRHFVVAPGSRNTPITIAATAPGSPFRVWLHLDERSAGYFALGIARQTGEPVAVCCTSGTAVANLLPAAVEARLSRVPLILLTADRPPEARDIGASQTIDQVGIFSTHVKWAADLPAADAGAIDDLERYAAAAGARAAAIACEAPAGPVHLNVPLREPLVDIDSEELPFDLGAPEVRRAVAAPSVPAPAEVARVVSAVSGRRGVIVCGPESAGLPASAITSLAAILGWPIVADPLSGLRAGRHPLDAVIDRADVLAREPAFTDPATPEVTIRFGAAPTSKPLNQWLTTLGDARGRGGATQIVVDMAVAAGGGWRDPDLRAVLGVAADPGAFCSTLLEALDARSGARAEWLPLWRDANAAARTALDEAIADIREPFEGQAVVDLAGALSEGSTLVAGNSMPVRDIDSFFPNMDRAVRIVGTRGASGIDGVTSSAVGAAAAASVGAGGAVALLIGDLSFLHDINGLWPVRRHDLSLTVVLVNNDGGGIFSFLPQRTSMPARFEEWWGTPHGLDLRHAVALHGGRHALMDHGPTSGASAAIGDALQRPGLNVLELRTDRDRNVALHQQVWARATEAVRHAVVAARA